MAYSNGRLPSYALVAIPGGRLEKNSARAWEAMRASAARAGVTLRPLGSQSSYRTYEQQVYWRNYWCSRGQCYKAARPGTSNHGWGTAVDVWQGPGVIPWLRANAHRFGWSNREGAAVGESWHWNYVGGYSGPSVSTDTTPTLKIGSRGDAVRRVQSFLKQRGFNIAVDGYYGKATGEAVRRVYRAWGHIGHNHVGDTFWKIIEGKHPWRVLTTSERSAAARLLEKRRIAKRNGGWDKIDPSHLREAQEAEDFLKRQNKAIHEAAARDGWDRYNRRARHTILHHLIT